jgi:hypothetical protein
MFKQTYCDPHCEVRLWLWGKCAKTMINRPEGATTLLEDQIESKVEAFPLRIGALSSSQVRVHIRSSC